MLGRRFDVILSDIAMPGLSGMQLVQAVRERGHRVQVVLATGNPTLETAMRAGALGVVHYLIQTGGHGAHRCGAQRRRSCTALAGRTAVASQVDSSRAGGQPRDGLTAYLNRAWRV